MLQYTPVSRSISLATHGLFMVTKASAVLLPYLTIIVLRLYATLSLSPMNEMHRNGFGRGIIPTLVNGLGVPG
jgi:hypothetical protein